MKYKHENENHRTTVIYSVGDGLKGKTYKLSIYTTSLQY